jgi:hypothetical protein
LLCAQQTVMHLGSQIHQFRVAPVVKAAVDEGRINLKAIINTHQWVGIRRFQSRNRQLRDDAVMAIMQAETKH